MPYGIGYSACQIEAKERINKLKVRVCPKCGYSDPPIWRTTPYRVHCDWARFEDFEQYYPHLKIAKGERVTDGLYAYKRSSKGDGLYVERQCLRDNPDALKIWIPDFESHMIKSFGHQRKLFER